LASTREFCQYINNSVLSHMYAIVVQRQDSLRLGYGDSSRSGPTPRGRGVSEADIDDNELASTKAISCRDRILV
jgi:hypothetical protein